MAVPFTLSTDQSATVQAAYDSSIADALKNETSFRQVAFKHPVSPFHVGKEYVLEIYKNLPTATTPLDEAIDPAGRTIPNNELVTIVPKEYGDFTELTWRAENTTWDNYFRPSVVNRFATQMFDTHEELIQKELLNGTNYIIPGGSVEPVVGTRLTSSAIRSAVTRLKVANVKKIQGYYVAFAHPSVIQDLREEGGTAGWREAANYSNYMEILNGEVGIYEGVRFIEHAGIDSTETVGSGSTAEDVYPTFVLGEEAIAEAAPNPGSIELGGTVVDPLNRKFAIGWKSFLGFKLYRPEAMQIILSASKNV